VEIVAERGREAREARLPPELRRRVRHCQRGGGLSAAASEEAGGSGVLVRGGAERGVPAPQRCALAFFRARLGIFFLRGSALGLTRAQDQGRRQLGTSHVGN
jgi:hypothetical protein